MTNDETHLCQMVRAALDGKKLQYHGHGNSSGWSDCSLEEQVEYTVRSILSNGANEYRIKPEVKTFTYQTRAYIIDGNDIRIWVSDDPMTQIGIEKHLLQFGSFKWLAPAQTHTVEYTE